MNLLSSIGFTQPWLLIGLLLLPILWWLLRATPPAAVKKLFPGVKLLLELQDPDKTPQRTPWWLMLLRCAIAALVIFAFAEPVLNPKASLKGDGPIVLISDGGWASAPLWNAQKTATLNLLDRIERAKRPIIYLNIAHSNKNTSLEPLPANQIKGIVEQTEPASWEPDHKIATELLKNINLKNSSIFWFSDGFTHDKTEAFITSLNQSDNLVVFTESQNLTILNGMTLIDSQLAINATRNQTDVTEDIIVSAIAPNTNGGSRKISEAILNFETGMATSAAQFELPLELRNKLSKIEINSNNHAAGIFLIDDQWRRKRVGIASGETGRDDQPFLSSLHYLKNALHDYAEIEENDILSLVETNVDIIMLADVGRFTTDTRAVLTNWVKEGGTLIRFAGPKLASQSMFTAADATIRPVDPLMPVRLRRGGRDLGGALSWGTPQTLRPFEESSPFFGLPIVEEITITRQVLAEPEPDLPAKTWARLTDGTPLVTHTSHEAGKVILFHTTANADWSSLPLSGVFVEMLGRLTQQASALSSGNLNPALAEKNWSMILMVDGYGALQEPPRDILPVKGIDLINNPPSALQPPGIYKSGEAIAAVNLMNDDSTLQQINWHKTITRLPLVQKKEQVLKPWLLSLALILFALDAICLLWLTGRLALIKPIATIFVLSFLFAPSFEAKADDQTALRATLESVFGYVVTGDSRTDEISRAGLFGLSNVLNARTSVEPALPIAVNIETDELAFYPILYWPMNENLTEVSDQAANKLNDYMRRGGLIVFDTKDSHLVADPFGAANGPGQRLLRQITAKLDMPALSPVPENHVISRSFYLLKEFPGRYQGGRVWLETPVERDEQTGEVPSGFSNDGVSPVLIGGHDWAAAWAQDNQGRHLLPVSGRAIQREMAYRFGVNLVMYAYTGNYKSDQVHIPELLERLGQ